MMWWPELARADYLPVQASQIAGEVDAIYNFILVCSVISFIILMGGMVYFMVKYRRKSENDKVAYISHNHLLELLWSAIPFVLFMVMFAWGYYVYNKERQFPNDALQISVTGKKWAWTVNYANGTVLVNEIVIPLGKTVVFNMTSEDVIHSFFLPSFRVKQDVVPGKMSRLTITPNLLGEYHLFCSEYCGTQHSQMIGIVRVVSPEEYAAWEKEQTSVGSMTPVQKGEKLYKTEACFTCHSLDGTRVVGPSFKGMWGRQEALEDGTVEKIDEAFVRRCILTPLAKIVKGYPPAMPSFQGRVSEEDINNIIEYLKTIK